MALRAMFRACSRPLSGVATHSALSARPPLPAIARDRTPPNSASTPLSWSMHPPPPTPDAALREPLLPGGLLGGPHPPDLANCKPRTHADRVRGRPRPQPAELTRAPRQDGAWEGTEAHAQAVGAPRKDEEVAQVLGKNVDEEKCRRAQAQAGSVNTVSKRRAQERQSGLSRFGAGSCALG